ncbi:MAG TPA: hypothetical protein VGI43_11350 [Mucilaginibacter sp.]
MEELIQKISGKTGISLDQAKGAIETVIDHLKEKLPMGLGDKVESFIQGGSTATDGFLSGIKDKLSGMF